MVHSVQLELTLLRKVSLFLIKDDQAFFLQSLISGMRTILTYSEFLNDKNRKQFFTVFELSPVAFIFPFLSSFYWRFSPLTDFFCDGKILA